MTLMVATPVTPEARVAQIGQAIGHPLRVRVLGLLMDGEPYRAGVLARRCHVALPLMKQHLLRLQEAQLILAERIDNAVYYRILSGAAIKPILALASTLA